MRKVLVAFVLCSAAAASAQNANIEQVGKSPVEAAFAAGGQVRMDLCSSGVEVKGRDENQVRVSYDGTAHARVRLQVTGSEARIRVRGCPHNNFHMTIEVPKSSSLYMRMFAGDLEVENVTGDKDAEVSFGQLTMALGKAEDYARVQASVNSGDLEASLFDVSKGGLFRSFERNGPGKYRVRAHVGAGELDLR